MATKLVEYAIGRDESDNPTVTCAETGNKFTFVLANPITGEHCFWLQDEQKNTVQFPHPLDAFGVAKIINQLIEVNNAREPISEIPQGGPERES